MLGFGSSLFVVAKNAEVVGATKTCSSDLAVVSKAIPVFDSIADWNTPGSSQVRVNWW